jgi:hypothetical protein
MAQEMPITNLKVINAQRYKWRDVDNKERGVENK